MKLTEARLEIATMKRIRDNPRTEISSGARADRLIKRGWIFWRAEAPIGWFLTDLGRAALAGE
jgi:hypothetical protein